MEDNEKELCCSCWPSPLGIYKRYTCPPASDSVRISWEMGGVTFNVSNGKLNKRTDGRLWDVRAEGTDIQIVQRAQYTIASERFVTASKGWNCISFSFLAIIDWYGSDSSTFFWLSPSFSSPGSAGENVQLVRWNQLIDFLLSLFLCCVCTVEYIKDDNPRWESLVTYPKRMNVYIYLSTGHKRKRNAPTTQESLSLSLFARKKEKCKHFSGIIYLLLWTRIHLVFLPFLTDNKERDERERERNREKERL